MRRGAVAGRVASKGGSGRIIGRIFVQKSRNVADVHHLRLMSLLSELVSRRGNKGCGEGPGVGPQDRGRKPEGWSPVTHGPPGLGAGPGRGGRRGSRCVGPATQTRTVPRKHMPTAMSLGCVPLPTMTAGPRSTRPSGFSHHPMGRSKSRWRPPRRGRPRPWRSAGLLARTRTVRCCRGSRLRRQSAGASGCPAATG